MDEKPKPRYMYLFNKVIDLDKVADFRPSDHVLSSLNSSATSSQANTSSASLGSSLRNSWLVMEVKQIFKDKRVKILLSTEVPRIYRESYDVEIEPKWMETLMHYDEEFLIQPTLNANIFTITYLK